MQRRDHQQREEPVDDGRNAGEQFQHRLEHLTGVMTRELRQVDRDDGPERDGDGQRHQRTAERARQQNGDAEVRVVEQRRPLLVGEEGPQRDVAEEEHRFLDQDIDDGQRGEDRNAGRQQQHGFDDLVLALAVGLHPGKLGQPRCASHAEQRTRCDPEW